MTTLDRCLNMESDTLFYNFFLCETLFDLCESLCNKKIKIYTENRAVVSSAKPDTPLLHIPPELLFRFVDPSSFFCFKQDIKNKYGDPEYDKTKENVLHKF